MDDSLPENDAPAPDASVGQSDRDDAIAATPPKATKSELLTEKLSDAVESILADADNEKQLAGLTAMSEALREGLTDRRGELGIGPVVLPVADLQRPKNGEHEELLKSRFLCRGGAAILVGPSGVGKSSFLMQAALSWSVGQPAFGIEPARPLRVVIFEAENDPGDLAEQRDGVLHGLSDVLTPSQRAEAVQRVYVAHVNTITGDRVAGMLRDHAKGFDLVIIDPVFAFIGGDVMNARDCSHWLREVLAPVLVELDIGLILSHHSNKPLRGAEKSEWRGSDLAYLGAGSAELTNFPRGVLAIRSIGSDSIFELRAPKRGKRLGWKDADGNPTTARLIGHSPDCICWLEVGEDERPAVKSTRTVAPSWASYTIQAVKLAKSKVWKLGEFRKALRQEFTLAENSAKSLQKFVEEADGVLKKRGPNKGDSPLFLIGPEQEVLEEIARLKREAEDAKQGKLDL